MPEVWTPLELVKISAKYLAEKGVPTPKLDAEILLCRVMGLPNRIALYAGFERRVADEELARYRGWIRRRAAREPVSHIFGEREFMGLTFQVTRDVLSPRPETEILVETLLSKLRPPKRNRSLDFPDPETPADLPSQTAAPETAGLDALLDAYAQGGEDENELDAPATLVAPPTPAMAPPGPMGMTTASALLKAAGRGVAAKPGSVKTEAGAEPKRRRPWLVLDLGTGSGCVAISVAACLSPTRVMGVDVSAAALAVARANADRLGVGDRVVLREGDWWDGVKPGVVFDAIVSNPPYLTEGDPDIWPEVRDYDPPAALYGGSDGYDFYRRLAGGWRPWLAPGGWLMAEVGTGQAERVESWWRDSGLEAVEVVPDHAGIGRVVVGRAGTAIHDSQFTIHN